MSRRQTLPQRWLLLTESNRAEVIARATRLAMGTGVLILTRLAPCELRRLRYAAELRWLVIVREGRGAAARVHNVLELRKALQSGTKLILLSPLHKTRTHPDWPALPRMRAATLARLGGRRLIALGGMDDRRYARIAQLGFRGWAGISAFRT